MELLVTVKAYPSISMKYGEAVCVAGVRLDTATPEWVRLFPVGYRDLPEERQFHKYEVVRLRARKHSTDGRAESWRPDLDSVERGQCLPAGGHWPARRRHVEPLVGPTMCQLNRGRVGGGSGPSLGVVRPARVCDVVVRDADPWTTGQLSTLNQGNLLSTKKQLEKPAHAFAYRWHCEETGCSGHTQTIVDWEMGEAYRSWTRKGYDPLVAIRQKWLDDICADSRETFFFVGDQHNRPGQFLILGAFYPEHRPDQNQLALDLAA